MSRHIPRQRIPSGIVLSAPLDLASAPRDTWRDTNDSLPDQTPKTSHPASHGKRHNVRHRHESDHINGSGRPFSDGIHTFAALFNTFYGHHVPGRDLDDSFLMGADHHEAMTTLCLPMLSVDIEVTVDGTLACSELTQTFGNPSDTTIREAKHIFPLYEGASVTAFECTIGDLQCLRGVVKPREEARQVYHEAVQNKRETAALLEEQSSEIFVTSLGNISPLTDVKIKLTYVHELKVVLMTERKSEGIAIIIPISIAPRVAAGSITDSEDWTAESHHEIDYQGKEPMKRVFHVPDASQLHFVDESPSASQQQGLEGDLVLVLPVRTGYQVQSRALISPPDSNGYAAMQVSFRPSDLFGTAVRPRSFKGEIIFVLDYSGSMHFSRHRPQSKLEVLGAAMSLALCGIPDTCVFNVLKFGSSTEGLWDQSRPHSAETIELARAYTTSRPDLGGTDLVRALKAAMKHLGSQKTSAQIIIITDGELDPMPVAEYVSLMRKKLGNKIRFFALGIGDHVSHRLIECVAELGGGLGDVVDVVAQPNWNCEIGLGSAFERQNLASVPWGKTHPSSTGPEPMAPYIQAPFPTPDLHPFSYQSIYFLVDLRDKALPREVTLTSINPTAKRKTCKLIVQKASINRPFVHQLAAKACLTGLETLARQQHSDHDLVGANAEHLGQIYSIISRWTSFVAVSLNIGDEEYPEICDTHRTISAKFDIEKEMHDYEMRDEERETEECRRYLRRHNSRYSHNHSPSSETSYQDVCSCCDEFDGGSSQPDPYRHVKVPLIFRDRDNTVALPSSGEHGIERCADELDRDLDEKGKESISSDESIQSAALHKTPKNDLSVPIVTPHMSARREAMEFARFTDFWSNSDTESELDLNRAASPVSFVHTNKNQKSLTWQDAVRDQMPNGTFRLLDTMRRELELHYCPATTAKVGEMILKHLNGGSLAEDLLHDCTDTITMIQYFRTHMVHEEDTWGLMMSRAESALLATLGRSDEDEDWLEPIYDVLRLSIMHQHFVGFQRSRNMDTADKPADENDKAVRCPVYEEPFGVAGGVRRFFCPYEEEVDDSGLCTGFVWDSWLAYWDHQVQTGHVLCSKLGVFSNV
ncbi:VIT and vWA domain-containing protein [Aspergillus brunneoviolaceus CBS 621.78]|uniref:Uncharacterized protein n=1 Tax=Aspergillus brunneoviolaceus CBS 621.78 TaxID=1450534 RepID=A0ACD1GI39_9EURO|nr:hypothetical protein BO95DRAFT_489029 [Aspergillus brunneoviolaceus CBS 621.78]RAH48751.1 hypothetical protein BO95DRAFT_489029 [Aspergillus brunneoviolaceus CBS 621.78]